jgi:hypothetical protein
MNEGDAATMTRLNPLSLIRRGTVDEQSDIRSYSVAFCYPDGRGVDRDVLELMHIYIAIGLRDFAEPTLRDIAAIENGIYVKFTGVPSKIVDADTLKVAGVLRRAAQRHSGSDDRGRLRDAARRFHREFAGRFHEHMAYTAQ